MRIAQQILAVTHVASFLHPHTTFYSSRTSNVLLSPRVSNYRTCSSHHVWRAVASASSSSSASPSSSRPFPANLRGVLFDMDGTLSDSESLHFKAYQVVFAKQLPEWSASHGPMTRDYYNKNMGGKTKLSALAQLLPNASPAERDSLCHDLEETFNVLAKSELKPLPGVYQLMDLLKKNKVKRALVTNAPPSEMRYAIDLLNLSGQVQYYNLLLTPQFTTDTSRVPQFDACVPSAECKAAKPHPGALLLLTAALRLLQY